MSAIDLFYRFGVPMIAGGIASLVVPVIVRRWWPKKKRRDR